MTTSRDWLRDWPWIIVIGMIVQAFWGLRLQQPFYFDVYYYTINGQRLASGHGFSQEIIWQYLDNPQGLPAISHTYWMPLTSMVAAAGYALSDTFRAAQVPFWLLASLLPLLSYAISWQLYRQRWQARMAAFLTMAGGYYAVFWVQPSTIALYAWAGGGCLLALALAVRQGMALWWLVAGFAAGLAHLTRADGVLLMVVAGIIYLLHSREQWRAKRSWPMRAGLMLIAGYLLIMGPWFYRTWLVTGQPLSTVGTQTIFLTTYDDFFAYNRRILLGDYLAWGWANILRSKVHAIWLALQTYIAAVGLTAFSFFVLLGWHAARRDSEKRRFLMPWTLYAGLLFLVMTLLFTFPGQRGSLFHSSSALWAWSMALVPAGTSRAVDWIAERRPHWQPHVAKRIFAVTFVIMAFAISLSRAGQSLDRDELVIYEEIGELVPADAIVMTGDPAALNYHSGLRAIATPNEPPLVMLRAARQLGAEYLLLDNNRPAPLDDLYEGRTSEVTLQLVRDFGNGYRLYRLPVGEQ